MTATERPTPKGGGIDKHERHQLIGRRLDGDGHVKIGELAGLLRVSEMTIRRDLDELESLGRARRVRGGAVAAKPKQFSARHQQNAKAKTTIARKLLEVLPDTGTIALDASTTVHRLLTMVESVRDLVAVTNGLDTFTALESIPGVTPTLTGGAREPRTGSLVGPLATRSADSYLFDLFLTSAAGLDHVVGSSEVSLDEAAVKRAFASSSARVVLAVDHTKLDSRAHCRMFELGQLHTLVTDLDPDDERLQPYRAEVNVV
jgi:DeoR family transcriptional regulator, fructose operon transcriptional repressor